MCVFPRKTSPRSELNYLNTKTQAKASRMTFVEPCGYRDLRPAQLSDASVSTQQFLLPGENGGFSSAGVVQSPCSAVIHLVHP